jgi:hypothetical protein
MGQYRTLDPITEGPDATGPSRDWHAIAAKEPVYRQERFALRPQRLPVTLATKERPRTTKSPIVEMQLGRVPILVRNSNQRPIEAGVSADGSVWGVSDPGRWHRHDSNLAADGGGAEAPAGVPAPWSLASQVGTRVVLMGAALGVLAYVMSLNKKRDGTYFPKK